MCWWATVVGSSMHWCLPTVSRCNSSLTSTKVKVTQYFREFLRIDYFCNKKKTDKLEVMSKIKIHVLRTGEVRVSPYLPFGGDDWIEL